MRIAPEKIEELKPLVAKFISSYPSSDAGRHHVSTYDAARKEARANLADIRARADQGEDVTDDVLLKLLFPQLPQRLELDAVGSVDDFIADSLYARAKLGIASKGPHSDKGELFVAMGPSAGPVVLAETFKAAGYRPGAPVGSQSEVDTENTFLFRINQVYRRFEKTLKVLGVADGFFAVCTPVVRIDKEKFDV